LILFRILKSTVTFLWNNPTRIIYLPLVISCRKWWLMRKCKGSRWMMILSALRMMITMSYAQR